MILSHFSATPLPSPLLPIEYPQTEEFGRYFKPFGLWLSDETDYGWREWCKENEFNLGRLKHETKFKVNMEGILLLDTPEKIRKFTKDFSFDLLQKIAEKASPELAKTSSIDVMGVIHIDWEAVKKIYSGIIITPYQWSLRLDYSMVWYYSWDCASGCIWDLSKIEVISHE